MQSDEQRVGVIFGSVNAAPVKARRVPVVPSAMHPTYWMDGVGAVVAAAWLVVVLVADRVEAELEVVWRTRGSVVEAAVVLVI